MAVDIDTIGIAVDTRDVKTASKDLDAFGKSADKASRQADNFGKTTEKGASLASSGMARFAGAVGVAYAAYQTFSRFASSADTYTKITSQLKLATSSQEQYNKALADVSRIANTAQANIEAVSKLYSRLSGSLTELGVAQTKIAEISETVALALKVSGAEAGETASVMLQLSQAFGSGVLRGDEFNSMAENSPILMRALASSLGVTTGALRDMASEGQITREILLKAFGDEKLLESLRKQAQGIGTVGGAIQIVKNNLIELVGTIDKSTGASAWVRDVFGNLAEYLAAMKLTIESGTWFEKLRFFTIGNLSERLTTQLRNPQGAGSAGNSLPGRAAITSGAIGPSFTSPRAVEDINEVHRKQEEAARKSKEQQDKLQDAITKKKLGQQELYWEREARLMEEKLDGIIKEDKLKAKLDKEEAERKEKYMAMLQKQANANYDEAQKKSKELEEESQRGADAINRSLTDALLRGFESGKGFARNFRDNLINMFKTLVLQPVIQFLIDSTGVTRFMASLSGALTSLGSSNAVAGEQGKGIFDQLSGIKDVFQSGNDAIVGSIQNLGVFLSNGQGGLGDAIGGYLGQYSAEIANVMPYAGAFVKLLQGDVKGAAVTAAATAIGSIFGPIGAGIGAVLGSVLGGLMGGGLPPRVTQSRTGIYSNGEFSSYEAKDPGKRKLGAAAPLDALNEQFAKNLSSIFSAFGLASEISSTSLLTKKVKTRSRFDATVNGQWLGFDDANFGKKGSIEDAFASLVERALGTYTVKAIQASDLPSGLKSIFDGLTKKEEVTDAINTIVQFRSAIGDLPPIFERLNEALETSAYTTTLAEFKTRLANVQTYTGLFYTAQENFDTYTKQLQTTFGLLNVSMPQTRDGFRSLVDGFQVIDEATNDQFHSLVALAPAMDQYFKYLEQQTAGINQVNQALAEGLNKDLYSTFADYVSAQASVANGLSDTYMAQLASPTAMSDAMIAEIKALRAENADLKTVMEAIAKNTYDTAKVQKQWNGDGLPETRTP